ncbi:dienelactone hydrolase family protein [Haliangium sp.]|uniref:dienelactone hydrolase family protein n=1 Tax=Haliangium sp. TaxID=2663208 RepID=UPI003D0AE4EA
MSTRVRFKSVLTSISVALLAVLGCDGGGGGGNGDPAVRLPVPDIDGIDVQEVVFDNRLGDPIQAAYLVPDRSKPMPAVIVLHGAGGLYDEPSGNDEHEFGPQFEEWAGLLYQEGYAVIMPASFFSRGFYEWNDAPDNLDTEDRLVYRVYDAYAALDFACRQPEIDCDRVAVMGFSNGGSASTLVMHERLREVERMGDLAADGPRFALSIPYYPGCGWKGWISLNLDEPDEFYFPYGPVYMHHAADDSLVDDCERRLEQTEMLTNMRNESENPFHMHIYDSVDHGFDSSPNDSREESARDDARVRTLELLANEL